MLSVPYLVIFSDVIDLYIFSLSISLYDVYHFKILLTGWICLHPGCHFCRFFCRDEDAGGDMHLTAGPFPGTLRPTPDFAPAGPFP